MRESFSLRRHCLCSLHRYYILCAERMRAYSDDTRDPIQFNCFIILKIWKYLQIECKLICFFIPRVARVRASSCGAMGKIDWVTSCSPVFYFQISDWIWARKKERCGRMSLSLARKGWKLEEQSSNSNDTKRNIFLIIYNFSLLLSLTKRMDRFWLIFPFFFRVYI